MLLLLFSPVSSLFVDENIGGEDSESMVPNPRMFYMESPQLNKQKIHPVKSTFDDPNRSHNVSSIHLEPETSSQPSQKKVMPL